MQRAHAAPAGTIHASRSPGRRRPRSSRRATRRIPISTRRRSMADPGLPNGDVGREMYALVAELYPICRSITGDGVRKTLAILGRHVPIEVHEVASGTPVLDWIVPKEWNIRDAWIADATGKRVVDFRASNL